MMIKARPKYHRAFIPALITILACLVVGLLVLAAFTRDTAFWVVISIIDVIIIYIGYQSIRKYRKTRIISTPLGKVLEYEGRVELQGEEKPHPIDIKVEKEVEKTED
ncbi:MAG: hypothetical protein GOP50_04515 [Candidatus Heimdallarchaeota archaeon]|nr:hypothetical protein [Candidatus Heimdallarchaeota archaeon]